MSLKINKLTVVNIRYKIEALPFESKSMPTTFLVTGASSGFGFAIAQRFAAQGKRVIACARRLDKLQTLQRQYPTNVLPLALDVRDRDACISILQRLPSDFAQVDVLINNAGLAAGLDAAHQANLDDWDAMIDTNCTGLVYMTRALLPGMVERNTGHVINIGSVAGEFPYPGGNVYGATKAFVHQFTHNLNADLVGTYVRASCIEPGLCSGTEFSLVRFKGDEARVAQVYADTEALTAEDIADTVEWVVTRPPHVRINVISMMPVTQASSALTIKRQKKLKS